MDLQNLKEHHEELLSFMENNVKFHGSTPTPEQFEQAFKELDAQAASLEV